MTKIGIIVNHSTRAAEVDIDKVCAYIEEKGGSFHRLKVKSGSAELMENFTDITDLPKDADCVMVLGGDGTIIQAARELAATGVPILGVNLGTVGFLAEVELAYIYKAIDAVMAGKYKLEKRFMLKGRVIKDGKIVYDANALNDIVVARGNLVRAISTTVYIDGNQVSSLHGDGIIVTTPTGSTGYNLSAGGTIILPDAEVFGIHPICPHSLNSRGVITSSASKIDIDVEWNKRSEPDEAIVSFDGNKGIRLMPGDKVQIMKSELTVPFLRINDFNFFESYRKKFLS
ncbi:NAD(+)/NADH kinase [Catonella massiliensis]|uniref:NAD kinase n=1 Tax=Catonella massiliensis TaxID=2799636 RepID=A0ABS1IX65_9FIRM|nr:NAD(+)/NADH kinase [Catonella massiliensis]MBK5896494.1 NAD(+)/NADH kinase [Catonella massiliensis]